MLPQKYERLGSLIDASKMVGSNVSTGSDGSNKGNGVIDTSQKLTTSEKIHNILFFIWIFCVVIVLGLGIAYAVFDATNSKYDGGPTQAQIDQKPAILNSIYAFAAMLIFSYLIWVFDSKDYDFAISECFGWEKPQ